MIEKNWFQKLIYLNLFSQKLILSLDLFFLNLLFLDRDKKRFVYQLEIVSKSGNFRAATSEVCSLYVDLSIRKVIEMEDYKLKLVDDFIIENKNQFIGFMTHHKDMTDEDWNNYSFLLLSLKKLILFLIILI